MKSGVAVAAARGSPCRERARSTRRVDLTWIFYDCEEVEAARNGLGRVARDRPEVLQADLAILLEPTDGRVEGGCQGTLRAVVRTTGRAGAQRSVLARRQRRSTPLAPILARLSDYRARTVDVDGLTYREGLNAVAIAGGVAGNVIPDECTVTVNYPLRPGPERGSGAGARARAVRRRTTCRARRFRAGRPARARPTRWLRPSSPRSGRRPAAKLGWTDVARFGALGIPAVNFGPGDPNLAHTREESVEVSRIADVEAALVAFLTAGELPFAG